MLKEVGASGLISLGKKYAGRTFDVIAHPGGAIGTDSGSRRGVCFPRIVTNRAVAGWMGAARRV